MPSRHAVHRACVLVIVWFATFVSAQVPTGPAFEVASVKPVKRDGPIPKPLLCGFGQGGRFAAFGWLRYFIACAYSIRTADPTQEILGGPKWVDADLYDIDANAPADAIPRSQAEGLPMLRTLLATRFKLALHRETREVPTYALVLDRRDRRLGPRLQPTPAACTDWMNGGRQGPPPSQIGDLPCGRQQVSTFALRATAMPMSQLANLLSPRVNRPVEDQTALTGTFALDLRWSPEAGAPNADDSLAMSVFTALREQLGLKLESKKSSRDVLVIDHVEPPTEN